MVQQNLQLADAFLIPPGRGFANPMWRGGRARARVLLLGQYERDRIREQVRRKIEVLRWTLGVER
jgi:hypothetical protein